MSKLAVQYLADISKYFIRKGKKSTMDNLVNNMLKLRAVENKKLIHKYLETCYHSAIPYIRLKTKKRRKGKRVINRVTFIERKKGQRLSLAAFSKQIANQRSERFISKFEKEIESFGKNKNYPARVNRDALHKTGLSSLIRMKKARKKFQSGNKSKKKKVRKKVKPGSVKAKKRKKYKAEALLKFEKEKFATKLTLWAHKIKTTKFHRNKILSPLIPRRLKKIYANAIYLVQERKVQSKSKKIITKK